VSQFVLYGCGSTTAQGEASRLRLGQGRVPQFSDSVYVRASVKKRRYFVDLVSGASNVERAFAKSPDLIDIGTGEYQQTQEAIPLRSGAGSPPP
jgi:hypothetical protein